MTQPSEGDDDSEEEVDEEDEDEGSELEVPRYSVRRWWPIWPGNAKHQHNLSHLTFNH